MSYIFSGELSTDSIEASGVTFNGSRSGLAARNVQDAIEEVKLSSGSGGGGSGSYSFIELADERTSGTNGGTPTTGSWQTRALNAIKLDTTGLISLSSDTFVLQPGTYTVNASAHFYRSFETQLRLYNVTNGVSLVQGLNNYIGNLDASIMTLLTGAFVVTSPIIVSLQYRCGNATASIGLGLANNYGVEVYSNLSLVKVA